MSADIHGLSGAYPVDALEDHERGAFERHLAHCDDCRVEVDSLSEAAASLSATVTMTPSAHLRATVLGNITKVRPLPPFMAVRPKRASRQTWLSGSLIAAATVALFVAVLQPDTSNSRSVINPAAQIVRAQDAVTVSQHLATGATLVWYRSARLDGAAISIGNLPTAASDQTYELWLQAEDGTLQPAGLVRGGTRLVALRGSARFALGAGLTMEPRAGSRTPSLPALALVAFPIR